jgi:RNA polymerase sigma factor (sigma-70 family)
VTVDSTDQDGTAAQFEAHRAHLHAVAYRMLGSLSEADDAVQEAWLRLARSDMSAVQNLRAWLTTVVSHVCLDMLRSRTARREDSLDVHVPDPVVTRADDDPQDHALLADSVGIALLVVLDTLPPAERLAFVLHDIFAVPFDDIGRILDRSPAAAKQLGSRARQRLRTAGSPVAAPAATADSARADRARQREIVTAFRAASQAGDFEALLASLRPARPVRPPGAHQRNPGFPYRRRRPAARPARDSHPGRPDHRNRHPRRPRPPGPPGPSRRTRLTAASPARVLAEPAPAAVRATASACRDIPILALEPVARSRSRRPTSRFESYAPGLSSAVDVGDEVRQQRGELLGCLLLQRMAGAGDHLDLAPP